MDHAHRIDVLQCRADFDRDFASVANMQRGLPFYNLIDV